MAESIVAKVAESIVAKVAELLVVPVGKHICYPFKYESNMAELKEQVENLKNARVRLQHDIEEAERQGHGIEDDVKKWMKSVDDFTEGVAKNIIGGDEDKENRAKKLCSIGFCPNLMARYSFSKKAAKTAKNGVNLLEKGKFPKVSYPPAIQRTGSIYNEGYEDFDSRTPIFQEIMQTLEDDNVNIIGVHGMGGVGKTTLVKSVVGKAIDGKSFDVVIMADVTQTPDIKNIQEQIANVLSLKFDDGSLDAPAARAARAAQLHDKLKEKRALLVLDDLWEILELKDVGILFGEGGNAERRQCKLLLTSRHLHVCAGMKAQKIFPLEILTAGEAGKLFWQIVGYSTKTSEFDTTGVEIIGRCAGLPVAIATIANALKDQDHSVWEDALDQLRRSNPRHIEGVDQKVYPVIKLSYDFLRQEEKSVFLLCSLYNASFNIDIDYLLQYCIGLGVFQGVSTMKQARNRLQTIINKLKASHLLLNGNTDMCVKLHDIVHAVANSIASRYELMFNIQVVTDLKETLEEKLPKNSTAMSLPFKDVSELPERLEFPKLELLVLLMEDTSLQIPDPFFEGMEGLKVLHLNEIHMLSLPSSLCRLTSLQTLRLNQCLLGDLAVIGALKRIKILSFLSSSIEQLPRELSQLTRLRLLDLRDCSNLKVISPNLISSLTQLEELYIGKSFVGWDVEGRSNASLVELKQLSRLKRLDICVLDARIIPQDLLIFEKLESFIIYIGDLWDWTDYFEYLICRMNSKLNYFESSRRLKLKFNDSNIYLGNDFRLLLNRAEDLHLDELKGVKNVVCQLDEEGFPQLKHLYVRNDPEIQYISSAIGRDLCIVFPKLELLFLNELVNLKKICHGQLAPESFNKLRIMRVQKCDTLNHLFSFSMVKNLSQLQEIEVNNCEKLEVIIFKESEEQVHQNDRISRVEFTQLHTLTLRDLPQLTSFVFHLLAPNTESQEIVSEDQPRDFMSLFSQNVAIPCLELLKLEELPKLLYLWKEDSQPRMVFENLTILNVSYCQNLKTLGPSSVSLEKLTTLTIHGCNGLMNLMTLSTAKTLVQLEEITIQDCKMLEEIITDVGDEEIRTAEAEKDAAIDKITLSMLNSITLDRLPNLITFHSGSNTLECPSLTAIFIENCPKMEAFVCPDTKDPSIRSASLFNEKVAFPCLKELTLEQLPELLHLWKEDSQPRIVFENLTNLNVSFCENLKTLVPSSVPLEKLTTLTVRGCNGLMNLITLSTAKTLVELKTIIINDCKMLEEIITDVGDEEIRTAKAEKDAAIDKITLFMLNSITLDRLPNFITFHSGSNTLECPSLTNIDIKYCPKIEAFVFPNRKDPSIRSASLFNEKVVLPISASSHLHGISIQLLQAMSSCLKNLTNLTMEGFDNLKYLFPSSMAESLVHLGFLHISNCKLMEVVIITQEERKSSTLFPKLNLLRLKDLPELRTFCCFTGNLIKLPSLNKLHIKNCPTMQTFASDSLCVDMLVIEEHEEVNTEREENLPSFFDEKVALPCLERLLLCKLPGLLHLWKENSQPSKVFENLSYLMVKGCGNLTTLLPSSVSLQNLLFLFVLKCDGLINLVPFSTAQSLKQLKTMLISDCKMIEEIIMGMGDEVKDKIVFDHLIIFALHCLPNLKSFCKGNFTIEFPSLRQVLVIKCLKMMSFSQGVLSTPKLQRPKLKEVDSYADDDDDNDEELFLEIEGEEDIDDDELILESEEGEEDALNWEGDLNTSIQQFFEDRKKMVEEIRFFKLKTGAEIPSVGLGTWSAAPGVVGDAVSTAVKVGYRHIDCAPLYGNEKEIGCALKKLLDDGVVKREELWITSKLWCTNHLPEDVPKAVDRTLQDLQLDYLDLYLIHWPVSLKKGSDVENPENLTQPDIPGTWRAMEALYDSGKARAIGVSNFSIKKLGDLLDIARVPPAVNQVECHPSWKQKKLHAFCKSKEVHLSGYSPLGSPSNKHEIEVLKDPILNTVAEKLGKSPAQVALRWGLQMGHSVLPKSTNEARLKENYDVFGWYIPKELLAKLSKIDQERLVKGTYFIHENFGAYRTLEELWDGEI